MASMATGFRPVTANDSETDIVDFELSFVEWVTTQGSRGRWRIAATGKRLSTPPSLTALAMPVMAGDVYGTGRLPLDPPYQFQLIASETEHTILRDYPASQGDTRSSNAHVFERVEVAVTTARAGKADHDAWPLVARLSATGTGGTLWQLEFPVNHMNNRGGQTEPKYQVETGPVLIPADLVPGEPAGGNATFMVGYVFWNRADRVDLLLKPAGRAGNRPRSYSDFVRLEGIRVDLLKPVRRA